MKLKRTLLTLLLALCLLAGGFSAMAAGLERPERYLGAWEGGQDYGDARDYYLELVDYRDNVFTANLLYYRLSYFENMTAFLTQDNLAVLSTSADDDYTVLATLEFNPSRIEMRVLDSDDPFLEAGTVVLLVPSTSSDD